jgi:preprotein translocase subunit SecD
MQNKYPLWKNLLLIGLVIIGLLYAAPNIFGEDPAVQISAKDNSAISPQLTQNVTDTLKNANIPYLSTGVVGDQILVRFPSPDTQLKARDIISTQLGDKYTVALNLAPKTPHWLSAIGANPMKLGLDLRGGVNFLLEVDTDALLQSRESGDMHSMGDALRDNNIRYLGVAEARPNGIIISFRDKDSMTQAAALLGDRFSDYQLTQSQDNQQFQITARMSEAAFTKINNYVIDQEMSILRNRINALGVSEALVQRQGKNHISVELPGIQDTTRAKEIIGKVATLKFEMVDTEHDAQSALSGDIPVGSKLYMYENRPVLLKDRVILHGDAITYAVASFGQDGRPSVNVRLSGSSEIANFNQITGENIGKPMAVIYVETKSEMRIIDGKPQQVTHEEEQVISVATIQSALGNNFEITGLQDVKYAQNLSLLLRAGALPAPVNFVQERTIGPSLGAINIDKGLISIIIGFIAVVIFMAIYYRIFGLVADTALLLNLIFIVAIFSIMGVTMTLPGMAAMVLTVGMAVDANVLIFERIREELRNGLSPQASIHIGYERAFITIVDSNVTTLIVAVILYTVGSGPVKGFAITLIVGILTSMMTAIVFTRGIVNYIYGRRNVKSLSIGIK